MIIVFRADASLRIGTGHIMRCLTLSKSMAEQGHEIYFMSRKRPGDLNSLIKAANITLFELEETQETQTTDEYSSWLSVSQEIDAHECLAYLKARDIKPDWLIVDHYGISSKWQKQMRSWCSRIMTIDDLGETNQDFDALLDQNLDTDTHAKHLNQQSSNQDLLLGPQYALVDQSFNELRGTSLSKSRWPIRNILISMGGVDAHNDTHKILTALEHLKLTDISLNVVLGKKNQHQNQISNTLGNFPNSTLHIQTNSMAKLMSDADTAFLACGTTSWEKCTLGLPSIATIQADNQSSNAMCLSELKAHILTGKSETVTVDDYIASFISLNEETMINLSHNCSKICDGKGLHRVIKFLEGARQC